MKKLNTAEFIKRSKLKFGDKFDYSKCQYSGMKEKVILTCKIHGNFSQLPDTHLNKGLCSCPQCRLEKIANDCKIRDYSGKKYKVTSKEEFLSKCYKKYGNKFKIDTSNFTSIMMENTINVICPTHGEFKILPKYLVSKCNTHGCSKCGLIESAQKRKYSYDELVEKCNDLFKFKYIYPEYNRTNYNNMSSKIDIVCDIHGTFSNTAGKHSIGTGCHKCKVEDMIKNNLMVGGYSEELFINNPNLKNVPAILYYLKINDGKYYKIGISKNTVRDRIRYLKSKAKTCGQLLTFQILEVLPLPLYDCFKTEQKILTIFKDRRLFRKWSTELFSIDILQNKSLKILCDTIPDLL